MAYPQDADDWTPEQWAAWEAEQERVYERRQAAMLSTPPTCLDGWATARAERPDVPLDGHGEAARSEWALACRHCGSDTLSVLGRRVDHSSAAGMVFDPVFGRCAACGRREKILDPTTDGYDALIGSPASPHDEPEAEATCAGCGGSSAGRVVCSFEYPGDMCEDSWVEEFGDVLHDGFSWINVVGTCGGCGHVAVVSECETA